MDNIGKLRNGQNLFNNMIAGLGPRPPCPPTPLGSKTPQFFESSESLSSSDDVEKISVESIITDYTNGTPASVTDVRKWMKGVLTVIKSEEEQLFD